MYILQNAIRNLGRNKGRNILMGVIILAIVATTAIALIINNTAGGIIDDYRSRFASEVYISRNFDHWRDIPREDFDSYTITPAQYIMFGQSDYLKDSVYTAELQAASDTLEAIDQNAEDGGGGNFFINRAAGGDSADDGREPVMPTLRLKGADSFTEFAEGEREIIDGSYYQNPGECIISRELAELNHISVGDVIHVKGAMMSTAEYEFTVAGIYEDFTEEYSIPFKNAAMNSRNEILTSFESLTGGDVPLDGLNINATYYLKSPEMIDDFRNELISKGLQGSLYNVATDESSFNTIVKPVEGLKGIAATFMIVVLALGAVIIILLSTIAMRERKYEIGVLRAMGMKKGKVALGLLSETLIITMACLILGLGVGIATAQPVSDMLLQGQVDAIASQNNNGGFMPGGGQGPQMIMGSGNSIRGAGPVTTFGGQRYDPSSALQLKEMDVAFGWDTTWQIIAISLLLAGFASIVGIRQVTRYEPMKILSDRT